MKKNTKFSSPFSHPMWFIIVLVKVQLLTYMNISPIVDDLARVGVLSRLRISSSPPVLLASCVHAALENEGRKNLVLKDDVMMTSWTRGQFGVDFE